MGKYRNSINKELFENTNSDSIEHIFYLNEYDTIRVPYKLYDTVMKYAYVNSLQASFLEIDLDSEYYNLVIIIPDYHDGLHNLAHKLRMHEANTFRHIRNAMEYYWVKTIVPKFNLKGNSVLTNDLQNVSVKVNLKKHQKLDLKCNNLIQLNFLLRWASTIFLSHQKLISHLLLTIKHCM